VSVVEAERLSRLEGKVEELSKRMDDFKSDINALRNEVIATRNEMNNRIDLLDKKLDSRFLWLLGIQVTMWVTIILTILFK
jgi:uncharacterized protein YlxW (UPF0749 family)